MTRTLNDTKAAALAGIKKNLAEIEKAVETLSSDERFSWANAGSLAQIEAQLAILADFAQSGTR